MAQLKVEWHAGGRGHCHWDGTLDLDRALLRRTDRPRTIAVCNQCAEKVSKNIDGYFEKTMKVARNLDVRLDRDPQSLG